MHPSLKIIVWNLQIEKLLSAQDIWQFYRPFSGDYSQSVLPEKGITSFRFQSTADWGIMVICLHGCRYLSHPGSSRSSRTQEDCSSNQCCIRTWVSSNHYLAICFSPSVWGHQCLFYHRFSCEHRWAVNPKSLCTVNAVYNTYMPLQKLFLMKNVCCKS